MPVEIRGVVPSAPTLTTSRLRWCAFLQSPCPPPWPATGSQFPWRGFESERLLGRSGVLVYREPLEMEALLTPVLAPVQFLIGEVGSMWFLGMLGIFLIVACLMPVISSYLPSTTQPSQAGPPKPLPPAVAGLRPSPARPAAACPAGTYLSWPVPAVVVLLVLGLAAAGVGSGGSPEGLLLAAVLNPILWGAAYSFWCIGKIRCPHCRKSFAVGDVAKQPVGSAIECGNCRNAFAKPLG